MTADELIADLAAAKPATLRDLHKWLRAHMAAIKGVPEDDDARVYAAYAAHRDRLQPIPTPDPTD